MESDRESPEYVLPEGFIIDFHVQEQGFFVA